MKSLGLKAKGISHKHCSCIDKVISHWGYTNELTILILQYRCSESEQLNK